MSMESGGGWNGGFTGGGRGSGSGPVFRFIHPRFPNFPPPGYLRPFFLIFIIILVLAFYGVNKKTSKDQETSQIKRSALTETVTYPEWYSDELGLISSEAPLTDGLEYFYSETGIQPYVMLLSYNESFWENGEWKEDAAETFLDGIYANMFSDGGHLIFAYFGSENDTESMYGVFYFYYGSSAMSVMDQEAETIFWNCFEDNYDNTDLNTAEFIGNTFVHTADRIMNEGGDSDSADLIFIIGLIAVLIYAVLGLTVIFIFRRKDKKIKQTENEKEI